jgi:hypothetical protein
MVSLIDTSEKSEMTSKLMRISFRLTQKVSICGQSPQNSVYGAGVTQTWCEEGKVVAVLN